MMTPKVSTIPIGNAQILKNLSITGLRIHGRLKIVKQNQPDICLSHHPESDS